MNFRKYHDSRNKILVDNNRRLTNRPTGRARSSAVTWICEKIARSSDPERTNGVRWTVLHPRVPPTHCTPRGAARRSGFSLFPSTASHPRVKPIPRHSASVLARSFSLLFFFLHLIFTFTLPDPAACLFSQKLFHVTGTDSFWLVNPGFQYSKTFWREKQPPEIEHRGNPPGNLSDSVDTIIAGRTDCTPRRPDEYALMTQWWCKSREIRDHPPTAKGHWNRVR